MPISRGRLALAPLLVVSCGGSPASHESSPKCEKFVGLDVKAIQNPRFPDVLPIAFDSVSCPAISFPWHTFGTDNSKITAFANVPRETLIQIDLFNATCIRNSSCSTGDLFVGLSTNQVDELIKTRDPETMRVLNVRIGEIRAFANSLPASAHVIVSLALEDNLSIDSAHVLRDLLAGFVTVSNPVSGIRDDGAEHHKIHGIDVDCSIADIISQDGGFDGDDSVFLDRGRDCFAALLWRPEWQGRSGAGEAGDSETLAPPRERDFRFTEDEAKEVNALLKAASGTI